MRALIKLIGDWAGQGVVQSIVVALVTLIGPIWAAVAGAPGWIVYTVGIVILAAAITIAHYFRLWVRHTARTASLQLQVYGDQRKPTQIQQGNIFRWYLMTNGFSIAD